MSVALMPTARAHRRSVSESESTGVRYDRCRFRPFDLTNHTISAEMIGN